MSLTEGKTLSVATIKDLGDIRLYATKHLLIKIMNNLEKNVLLLLIHLIG